MCKTDPWLKRKDWSNIKQSIPFIFFLKILNSLCQKLLLLILYLISWLAMCSRLVTRPHVWLMSLVHICLFLGKKMSQRPCTLLQLPAVPSCPQILPGKNLTLFVMQWEQPWRASTLTSMSTAIISVLKWQKWVAVFIQLILLIWLPSLITSGTAYQYSHLMWRKLPQNWKSCCRRYMSFKVGTLSQDV